MTDFPTATKDGAIWVTGKELNQIAEAGTQRTVTVAAEWRGCLVLTERPDGLELRVDLNVLLQKYGTTFYVVQDGQPAKCQMLAGEVTLL